MAVIYVLFRIHWDHNTERTSNSWTLEVKIIMAPPKKMDKGMALAIMGFANARPLELVMSKPEECREVLDKALYKRTQDILHNPNGLELPSPGGGGRRKSGTAGTLNISNSNDGRRRSMKR